MELMTLCTQGYLVPVHAGFFNGVSEPDGDRLDGSPKSLFITAASLFLPSVITLRWSDRTRARSVVRPHPPNGQPSPSGLHSAFWCVATTLRATIRISCRILQQLNQAKLWVKKKVH